MRSWAFCGGRKPSSPPHPAQTNARAERRCQAGPGGGRGGAVRRGPWANGLGARETRARFPAGREAPLGGIGLDAARPGHADDPSRRRRWLVGGLVWGVGCVTLTGIDCEGPSGELGRHLAEGHLQDALVPALDHLP